MTVMTNTVDQTREQITRIAALLFERQLTDAAGGNISARAGDLICMSATRSGSRRQWQIGIDDVLVVDRLGVILDGDGALSRESNVHLRLHNEFAEAGSAVIHAHPRNLLTFAALARSMPAVLEANLKFGEIPCVAYAPAHSEQLAENIAAALRGQEARIRKQAFGAIAPWHGLFLMGHDLDAAFDAVERFDTNARVYLQAKAAGLEEELLTQSRALAAAADAFGKL